MQLKGCHVFKINPKCCVFPTGNNQHACPRYEVQVQQFTKVIINEDASKGAKKERKIIHYFHPHPHANAEREYTRYFIPGAMCDIFLPILWEPIQL